MKIDWSMRKSAKTWIQKEEIRLHRGEMTMFRLMQAKETVVCTVKPCQIEACAGRHVGADVMLLKANKQSHMHTYTNIIIQLKTGNFYDFTVQPSILSRLTS